MKLKLSHPKHCAACGRERVRGDIGYDVLNMNAYCLDYHVCQNEKHPNHPKYTTERGHAKELISLKESAVILDKLDEIYGPQMDQISRVLAKSASLRLSPPLAFHVLKVAQQNSHRSVNETLNFIIAEHAKDHDTSNDVLEAVLWEQHIQHFHNNRMSQRQKVLDLKEEVEELRKTNKKLFKEKVLAGIKEEQPEEEQPKQEEPQPHPNTDGLGGFTL